MEGRCRSRSDESQCSTEQSERRDNGENDFVDLGRRYVVCEVCISRGCLSPDDIYVVALYPHCQPISLDLGHLVYMLCGIRL